MPIPPAKTSARRHAMVGILFRAILAAAVSGTAVSCVSLEKKQLAISREEARAAHATWRAETRGWKWKTYKNEAVLEKAIPDNTSVQIALAEQRGFLLVDGQLAMDFPVATGKPSHPTPPGEYRVLGKQKDYSSNLYGKIVDTSGAVLVSEAEATRDIPPEGAVFEGAKMPYWMRLTNDGVGMHVGYVPGHRASHGCIRLKQPTATKLFEVLKTGSPVLIAERAPALEAPAQKKKR